MRVRERGESMIRYADIRDHIEQKINEGQFVAGQKLPSVRDAAKLYDCSVSTIKRAYAELEKRHAIYVIAQSGYYVVEKRKTLSGDTTVKKLDFSSASPDPSVFPYLDFQHCMNKALDTYKHELFVCGDSRGLEELRHTLVAHLAGDQVFTSAERIIVTSGIQQALEILTKMPFPNGKSNILIEQPTYDNFIDVLEAEGHAVCGIARTAAGIDLRELEELFKLGNIKFFYTMTRHHNPLGTSHNVAARKVIAKLASKYDVYIVEDDYMPDLGEEPGCDPIYAYNDTSHVVYLKSFSKIIFPGLRLGAAVLPEKLLESFRHYKRFADTSLLSQATLEVYLKNGMYDRHKRKIITQYETRIRALREAVIRYDDAGLLGVADVQFGVYAQIKLPQTVHLERLVERLAANDIIVVPGKRFYLSDYLEREKFLRMSVALVLPEQIDQAVRKIVEEVRREVKSLV
ncbi:DNA-binding transcriptional MocR family regulator [Paenibacillus lupini]|nr:DNA-binding transcriptional MocR family regulator [Paenibacillus lupini]